MHGLSTDLGFLPYSLALDSALRAALPTKAVGLSTFGIGRPITIWMDDTALPADDSTALSIASAHDPVFISTNKTQIASDGVDTATISVLAPKPGAAAVSLVVTPSGGMAANIPVTLSGGAGSVTLTCSTPEVLTVTVLNPANRSNDTLTIKVV